MQGQRGAMGSLPETLDIDRTSSPRNAAMSHQLCWTNLPSHSEIHLQSLMLPPSTDSLIRTRQHWPVSSSTECSGSSSSYPGNSVPERKLGNGLPSSAGLVQHPENQAEPANTGGFALDGFTASTLPIQMRNPPSLSLNGHRNNDKSPNVCPTDQVADGGGTSGVTQEEINGARVGSSTVRLRRLPCKRKSLEGHIGQSSTNPESHFRQDMSSEESRGVPASFSSLPQQAEPRLQQSSAVQVLGQVSSHPPSYNAQERMEDLGRNLCLRMLSSRHVSSSNAVALQNSVRSTSRPSGFTPLNHAADLHSLSVPGGVPAAHRPLVIFNAPASAYSRHPSSASVSGNVVIPAYNPATSGRSMRVDLGYPVLAMGNGSRPPIQNSVIRGTADSNGALPGNAVYSSVSHMVAPQPPISETSNPSMVPLNPIHHAQYLQINSSRRLSAAYVNQALLASANPMIGGESSLASHSRGSSTPSPEAMLLAGLVNQGRRRSSSRSSHSMERVADSMLGGPYSRHAAPLRDDRRRLAELRNVMETMRRGQGLRLEDIMLLHQSALLRVADLHDRHRDLRLDVDNMSYEELLALEERIGNVSTGLNEETVQNRLKQRKLDALAVREGEVEPCCICQEEYINGADIGTLDCGHKFHAGCIKEWLTYKNSCPICKTTGLTM